MTINKVDSNISGLAYCEEQALGVLIAAPIWYALEPNSYADFGANYPAVARAPINASRQKQKGTTVDQDAAVGFSHDWMNAGMLRPAQSFFFAAARQKADTQPLAGAAVVITAVDAVAHTYAAAAGLDAFKAKDLVLASGFTNAGNNGVKAITVAVAALITLGAGLTAEAAPPAAARLQKVGVEFAAADCAITLTGTTAVNLTSIAYDFTTLGLIPGEWVFLGGDAGGSHFVNNRGYARVRTIAAHLITFDQTTWTAVGEAAAGITLRMFFGDVLRNESTPALIVTKSLQFERSLGSDAVAVQSEYVLGCVGNELTLNLPKADKMTVDLTFVGIDKEERSGATGVKAGGRVAPIEEDAVNTSSDIYRTYMTIVDPTAINSTALFGYVQDAKLSIGNGVVPNKALGVLGAFDVSAGDFSVGGSVTAYFTTVAAVAAIRNNSDIGFNVITAKQNSGFVFDIPLMSISGGRLKVEKDQPIMIPLENTGYENDLGYTLMYCRFPYLPDAAMPS